MAVGDNVIEQKWVKSNPASGWREVTLSECTELIRKLVSPSDMEDALYIGLEHIGEGTLSLIGQGSANDVTSTKSQFQRGDILFGKLRPYFRKVVRAPSDGLCSTDIWVVRARDEVIQDYLYYCIASQQFVDFVTSGSEGTRMPRATWEYASRYRFSIPTLSEQHTLADVLSTLDDKIDLNRRMNQTLNEMARALFKSWFVYFEPVRIKMEGRWRPDESLPGLPADLYDIFPDRLVDSEAGVIPEGWEIKTLGDVTVVVGGTTPSTKVSNYWERGKYNWATPKDLATLSSPVLLDTERKVTDAGLDKIGSGLLPVGTLLLSSRAPIGYLAISEKPVAINQGFIAMPPQEGISNLFLLYWCEAFHDLIIDYANGSTFLEISKRDFRRIPMVMPDEAAITAFANYARPLHEQIVTNECESRTLAVKRDALLPKLVSGDLRL